MGRPRWGWGPLVIGSYLVKSCVLHSYIVHLQSTLHLYCRTRTRMNCWVVTNEWCIVWECMWGIIPNPISLELRNIVGSVSPVQNYDMQNSGEQAICSAFKGAKDSLHK